MCEHRDLFRTDRLSEEYTCIECDQKFYGNMNPHEVARLKADLDYIKQMIFTMNVCVEKLNQDLLNQNQRQV